MSEHLFDRRALLGAGLGAFGAATLGGCQALSPTYRFPYRLTTKVDVGGVVREAVGGGEILWRLLNAGTSSSVMSRYLVSGSAGMADLGPLGRLFVTLSRYDAAGKNRWLIGHPWDPTPYALKSLGLTQSCDDRGDCTGLTELIRRAAEVQVTLGSTEMPIVVLAHAPWKLNDLTVLQPPELGSPLASGVKILSCQLELKPAPDTIPAIQATFPWIVERRSGSLGVGPGTLYPNSLQKRTFYMERGAPS